MSKENKKIPDFSIVIPTFNRCNFLRIAIKSILRQKDVTFEVIVSDNCSTDNTEKVTKEFNDKRIKYFKNKRNIGFPLNERKAFSKVSGKFVFTLSDDDFVLYDDTLYEVFKIMKEYKVGIANIGTINWSRSTKFPCRIFNLSDKLLIFKPQKDKVLSLNVLKVNYAFYSGFIFDSLVINPKQIIESYMYSSYPLVFDTARKYGLAYIPNHFTVSRISLRFVSYYYNLNKLGNFFIEEYLMLIKQFLKSKDYKKHKKEYLLGSIINLPSVKLFTNNKNYIRIIQKIIYIDNTLLINTKFYVLVLIGFMPKSILKTLRNFMIYLSERKSISQVKKYKYFENIDKLAKFKLL